MTYFIFWILTDVCLFSNFIVFGYEFLVNWLLLWVFILFEWGGNCLNMSFQFLKALGLLKFDRLLLFFCFLLYTLTLFEYIWEILSMSFQFLKPFSLWKFYRLFFFLNSFAKWNRLFLWLHFFWELITSIRSLILYLLLLWFVFNTLHFVNFPLL